MENYKKKYKEALDRARGLLEGMDEGDYFASNGDIENIFPELKENKSERVRKGLIKTISSLLDNTVLYHTNITKEEALAWLEKQGEQKSVDKAEPKFKVGDFIINDYCLGKVIVITNDAYLLDTGQGIPFSCENAHLWTIQDAKDGDVLATENFIFIFKNIDDGNGVHYYCQYEISKHENDNQFDIALPQSLMGRVGNSISHYSPATKEQRDLLFQKMKEVGYEWDSEKKEVKKIEVANKESKDERIRKELIEQVAYITPNNDELDDELNTLPTYQKRIDKYRAWLEKQGEKKPFDYENVNIQQKDFAPKVEPKFKVGDKVIIKGNNTVYTIGIIAPDDTCWLTHEGHGCGWSTFGILKHYVE